MKFGNTVMYQVYPLGLLDSLYPNDGQVCEKWDKLASWIPYWSDLGIDTLLLNPCFSSDYHGYDTRDLRRIDERLGTWEGLQSFAQHLAAAGIKLVFDAVCNHVGRGFFAFQDVLRKREQSQYKDWFCLDFGGNSAYNDGFAYVDWEGHSSLVKLNLRQPEVKHYLLTTIGSWVKDFQLAGLRLDVAYLLDQDFVRELQRYCQALNPDFYLIAELVHGDYKTYVNPELCDSCTNYEAYKSLWSAFNTSNLFEIGHSLQRCFGSEPWCLYTGKQLLSFADNHDVNRIATQLKQPELLPLLYTLLFAMPGVPCLYYGSEWGELGNKKQGDEALRPAFSAPRPNELSSFIKALIKQYKALPALAAGAFQIDFLRNQQLVFRRQLSGANSVICALNLAPETLSANLNLPACQLRQILSTTPGSGEPAPEYTRDRQQDFTGILELPPQSAQLYELLA